MIRRALLHLPSATVVAALAVHSIPVLAVLGCLGLTAYLCRQILLYKLATKALDKVPATQGAAIVRAIVGHCEHRCT
jgi:hypothetical protein